MMYRGREEFIPWDRIPPDIADFPVDVQKAISCYGRFGDKIIPEYGYVGKDFTLLDTIIETEHVGNKEIFLEALLRLDEFLINKSRTELEEARKKQKNGKQ